MVYKEKTRWDHKQNKKVLAFFKVLGPHSISQDTFKIYTLDMRIWVGVWINYINNPKNPNWFPTASNLKAKIHNRKALNKGKGKGKGKYSEPNLWDHRFWNRKTTQKTLEFDECLWNLKALNTSEFNQNLYKLVIFLQSTISHFQWTRC